MNRRDDQDSGRGREQDETADRTGSFRGTSAAGPSGREAASPPTPPPELLHHPRYAVLGFLGAGGMGVVFKARHRLMDRVVALKVISRRLLDRPDMVERFHREVRAAARLHHPNIVTAYDAEQAGDTHLLVMEYVHGVNLDELLAAEGRFPVDRACEYARQVAVGLQHAHERGLVHRDIKPHNLMLTPAGQVKILDFGLARHASEVALGQPPTSTGPTPAPAPRSVLDDPAWAAAPTVPTPRARTGQGLTSSYAGFGTADYLAPEEALDARRADVRADIYSLGCTLYRFLAGQVPFPEGDALAKVRAHLERTPPGLCELRPEVPRPLARVVERMMAKEPSRRYATPADVMRALTPFAARAAGRVLVVDDDPLTREAMRQALAEVGYAVDVAADGGEALALLRRGRPHDLVLLDLFMPGVDGWQFLEQRKRDPALAAVPVVVVSAADPCQARALALGAADHLQKPVEPASVAEKVRGLAAGRAFGTAN